MKHIAVSGSWSARLKLQMMSWHRSKQWLVTQVSVGCKKMRSMVFSWIRPQNTAPWLADWIIAAIASVTVLIDNREYLPFKTKKNKITCNFWGNIDSGNGNYNLSRFFKIVNWSHFFEHFNRFVHGVWRLKFTTYRVAQW